MPLPELLVVNAVTAFDFAVLLWSTRRDVAMSDACGLHRQCEVERELSAVVALQPANRKRHGLAELAE